MVFLYILYIGLSKLIFKASYKPYFSLQILKVIRDFGLEKFYEVFCVKELSIVAIFKGRKCKKVSLFTKI